MCRFIILRLFVNIVVALVTIRAYPFGAEILTEVSGFDYWSVRLVGGAIASAATFQIVQKIKEFIFFMFKCGTIWSVCHPEDKSILAILTKVTNNWKETLSLPLLNKLIRNLFNKIFDCIKDKAEIPEVLQEFSASPLISYSKYFADKVFKYADECVLAWCYKHDDSLFSECITGFVVFIKHAGYMIASIVPVVLLNLLLRIFTIIGSVYLFDLKVGITIHTVIVCYVIALCVDYVLMDSIIEPMFMSFIVKRFSKYFDEEEDAELVSKLNDVLDFSELQAFIRRFSKNDTTTGDKNDFAESGEDSN